MWPGKPLRSPHGLGLLGYSPTSTRGPPRPAGAQGIALHASPTQAVPSHWGHGLPPQTASGRGLLPQTALGWGEPHAALPLVASHPLALPAGPDTTWYREHGPEQRAVPRPLGRREGLGRVTLAGAAGLEELGAWVQGLIPSLSWIRPGHPQVGRLAPPPGQAGGGAQWGLWVPASCEAAEVLASPTLHLDPLHSRLGWGERRMAQPRPCRLSKSKFLPHTPPFLGAHLPPRPTALAQGSARRVGTRPIDFSPPGWHEGWHPAVLPSILAGLPLPGFPPREPEQWAHGWQWGEAPWSPHQQGGSSPGTLLSGP